MQNNGEPNTLPADVRELLDTSVESIDSLDALLLLSRDPTRMWAVREIALAIDVNDAAARQALVELKSRGLASEVPGGGELYRMAALTPLALRAFAALSTACSVDRRAVVEYMSRRSLGRLKLLAHAFTRNRTP